ncbi:MAG TPA: hypothetical protein PK252_08125 [Bacteroidales bacterium]|nr:hypothetical protein [Bacteroidales bacterium]
MAVQQMITLYILALMYDKNKLIQQHSCGIFVRKEIYKLIEATQFLTIYQSI